MAKNEMIIAGADCKGCKHLEDSESNNKITCKVRDKQYYYGQCIMCDIKEKEK